MSIFKNGGNGNPKNVVVSLVNGGIYRVFTSNDTETVFNSLLSLVLVPVPDPVPPRALYSKSGYLEIPSLQPPRVSKLTV